MMIDKPPVLLRRPLKPPCPSRITVHWTWKLAVRPRTDNDKKKTFDGNCGIRSFSNARLNMAGVFGHTSSPQINGDQPSKTNFLIIGSGPAGLALACFLSAYGIKGIIVTEASSTAKQPRAHLTNAATLECLRDIGLEEEIQENGVSQPSLGVRWCYSMFGDEFARLYSFGNQPHRRGEYYAASPCRHVDIPQSLVEPILLKHATASGWEVRLETSFKEYEQTGDGMLVRCVDRRTSQEHAIHTKYLFGCDGGRSAVQRQLGISLTKGSSQGNALNVHIKADLSSCMKSRNVNMHWVIKPDQDNAMWNWSALFRQVKPYDEWVCVFVPHPSTRLEEKPSEETCKEAVKRVIGDENVAVEVLDISRWNVNDVVADKYSQDNVFCLGDAVHRHPPVNGLGSNTSIQDAWNLAWKLAYVESGMAKPTLLDTYNQERQPVGVDAVRRANQGFRTMGNIFEALGHLPADRAERTKQFQELSAPSKAGRERRARLAAAVKYADHEFGGLGIEMNQRYISDAVYASDELEDRQPLPADAVVEYQIGTYPGSRLPHAWLTKRSPESAAMSTIDLAGHGAFCLLTGIGGGQWVQAAQKMRDQFGLKFNAYSIGCMQDLEDVYSEWADKREVEDDGCVLTRPDRTVIWRSRTMQPDCYTAIMKVVLSVLGRSDEIPEK
ncbi:Hypothetical protein R9X50_00190800 [Acrodontium crateriforme]|uniref:FAD-binding domain-containing protein n=1 Tax=Acrodontium crateriforme TaxID=150365 RepID=A0AAQ3R8K2_9PEZI|nr:Hypothetical protein R9X50_00190800 [Acrodontium crateriforme]